MSTDSKTFPKVPSYVCNFPFKPNEKVPARVTREQSAQHLYGHEDSWNEVFTFVSTDKITLSLYYLPSGSQVDPAGYHAHGDEYYHILEGEAVIINPESGESIHLDCGDTAYIPQGTRHQVINFSENMLAVLTILAPVPWKNDGMGTAIPKVENAKYFVPGVNREKGKFDGKSL